MLQDLKIERLRGHEILAYLPHLARLRAQIFEEYPYLAMPDLPYETRYLNTYASCTEAILVIVFLKNEIIGASTAIPLEFETPEFKKPFENHKIDVQSVFYLGESVLLPAYRGQHIYQHFFHEREAAANEYGSDIAAFCAVEHMKNDPRRPKNYTPLDPVWNHFGYKKHPELTAYFQWQEIGEQTISPKPLTFWIKHLKENA
jgi:hypothetical protein